MENSSRFDIYPHRIFANVLLLDGMIKDWKTGNYRICKKNHYWKKNPLYKRIKIYSKSWIAHSSKQHSQIFNEVSEKFYRQFPIHPDFKGFLPYKKEEAPTTYYLL